MTTNLNGIILIDKPAGISSFGVVGRVRWQLSQAAGKKVKVGHTGTLDPFATGLLILVVGTECKKASNYSKLDKVYEATIKLGSTSSTSDPEGEILEVSDIKPILAEINQAIKPFIGGITQTPPAYSAIKINGQRAYKLARAGKTVEMPSRQVTVHSLDLLDYTYPYLKIRTHVSSGTYIRSLAADIGEALKTGAYTLELKRIQIGEFKLDNAESIDKYIKKLYT